jgi:hypothetical protein
MNFNRFPQQGLEISRRLEPPPDGPRLPVRRIVAAVIVIAVGAACLFLLR